MSKIDFLRKLQDSLHWTFSQEEIADILSDYESFFATGGEEGKTEKEIIANLGSPSAIAQDLAESLGKKKLRPLSARIIKRIALSTTLFLISLVYYFAVYASNNIVRDSILMFAGFSVVLWFALGGTFRGSPPVSRFVNASWNWLLAIGHILLLCIVAVFFILLLRLESELLSGIDVLPYAQIVIALRTAFVIIALIIGAFSIFAFYRFSTQYFTVTSHAVGAVAYFSAAYNVMSQLNTPEFFYRAILLIFVVYCISIFFTSLFAFFIRITSRKGIK